jgi:hypothetical protein
MNRPTLASTPAISSPPPIGQPVAGSESRLAPPLPAPPPDLRLFAAALLLLAVALTLVCLAAAKSRRPRPAGGRRQAILRELHEAKIAAGCPCHAPATSDSGLQEEVYPGLRRSRCCPAHQTPPGREAAARPGTDTGSPDRRSPALSADAAADMAGPAPRPCADRVHVLLTEFAAEATGLPCARMTTPELQACQDRLPAAVRAAFARLLDALAAADTQRFTPRPPPPRACLVDTAVAALRNWPAPTGSTDRS